MDARAEKVVVTAERIRAGSGGAGVNAWRVIVVCGKAGRRHWLFECGAASLAKVRTEGA